MCRAFCFLGVGKISVTCQLGQRKSRSEHRPPPDRAHSGLLTGACGCWPENNQNPKAGYCRHSPFAPRVRSVWPQGSLMGGTPLAAPYWQVHCARATDGEHRLFFAPGRLVFCVSLPSEKRMVAATLIYGKSPYLQPPQAAHAIGLPNCTPPPDRAHCGRSGACWPGTQCHPNYG